VIYEDVGLAGVALIELELHTDERGFFARTFCARDFEARGLSSNVAQCSLSYTQRRGTLRGLHFQRAPASEDKLVRCVRGAIYDVAVDLRVDSPTRYAHAGVELTAENRRALFIPKGFAHGFQTLADDTEVLYQISAFYVPELAAGVRFDDPRLGIRWPLEVAAISDRDRALPLLDEIEGGLDA
jgi:dTDP-4-dehydrorhamnose 3,5-epimerase